MKYSHKKIDIVLKRRDLSLLYFSVKKIMYLALHVKIKNAEALRKESQIFISEKCNQAYCLSSPNPYLTLPSVKVDHQQ